MKLKHSAYVVVAISLGLCGCPQMSKVVAPAPAGNKQIGVTITVIKDRKTIAVSEDPAIVTADKGAITWNLPNESSYLFPRDGIVIDPGNFSPCVPTEGGKSFMCVKRGHQVGYYKYIVNVNDGSKPLDPLPLAPLDPWIENR